MAEKKLTHVKDRVKENVQKTSLEVVKQMLSLATSGFGLVAALAWNNVIQELVNNYIKKFLPTNSGLVSLLLYALIVTILAVLITLQLTHLKEKFER